jgi:hypothetical protein
MFIMILPMRGRLIAHRGMATHEWEEWNAFVRRRASGVAPVSGFHLNAMRLDNTGDIS